MRRILLWDLPTRLFHWLLVLSVVAIVVSGKIGGNLIIWHGRIGIFIVGLLSFRLVWGFIGGSTSRFTHFFPTPSRIKAYLRGEWEGVGHNPLGAFSVFGLLTLLFFQALSGLFTNDDIAFYGPLFSLINKETSDWLTGAHELAVNLLILLIFLHIAAILFYAHVKKDNLLKPMITGYKDVKKGESVRGGGSLSLLIALLFAFGTAYVASGAWIANPPSPPPAAVSAPAW